MATGIYTRTPEQLAKLKLAAIGNKSKTGIPQTHPRALANLKSGVRFGQGHIPWNKGRKRPEMSGEKHFAWKGGTYDRDRKIDMGRKTYRVWRLAVLERDGYSCIWCGGQDRLNVDHIESYAHYPELRYDVENGRTLCVDCHKTTETYGGKNRHI